MPVDPLPLNAVIAKSCRPAASPCCWPALTTTEERLSQDADLQRTIAELTRQVLHGE